jgi:type IV pilus assembly protein PilE
MPNDMNRDASCDMNCAAVDRRLAARAPTGFTLMDLLAALAIASLLACVAVPSYRAQVIRAHRSDARAALLSLAAAEESFNASCNAYAAILDDSRESSCSTSSLQFPASAGHGSYELEVTTSDATGWSAAATAVAGSPQDADERCRVLRLTSAGHRSASRADGSANDEECWAR